MKNLSDQFKPSSTFVDLDKLEEKEKSVARLFQLSEFVESSSGRDRSFIFDSETARNFDQDNINKAKQGVKQLMEDAVAKAKAPAKKNVSKDVCSKVEQKVCCAKRSRPL